MEFGRDHAGEVGEECDGRVEDGEVFSGAGDGCKGVEGWWWWCRWVGVGIGFGVFEEVLEVLNGAVVAGTVIGMGGDALRIESEDYFWHLSFACSVREARRWVAV